MIAYEFPPAGGAGVQRTVKFVKYLPDSGWMPFVLTVKNPLYPLRDETLMNDVPAETIVVKATEWLPNGTLRALRSQLRGDLAQTVDNGRVYNRLPGIRSRIKRFLRLSYVKASKWAIPDQHIAWTIPALLKAKEIIRNENPEVVYLTVPPFSVLLTGYLLHLLSGISYVVDFRDAWTLNPLRVGTSKATIEAPLEQRVIASASRVIFATPSMQQDYAQKYPPLVGRFCTITNGYDECDFVGVSPKELKPISIVYMGRITPKLKLENFLIALSNVLRQNPVLRSRVRLYFVGDIYMTQREKIESSGLQDVSEFLGYLPHREALRYALGADILLLLGSGDLAEMTGKVFEYLRANRPIFAVVPHKSAAGQVIHESAHGIVAQYDNIPEISAKLEELLLRVQSGNMPQLDTNAFIRKFDRKFQTRQLADVLTQASGRRKLRE